MKEMGKIVCIFLLLMACASKQSSALVKDFTLVSLDGEEVTLSNLKGNVVLVDFWATWCPPCRNSIPVLAQLYKKYQGQGFVVLGISQEEKELLQRYKDEHAIPYPILQGTKDVFKLYGVEAIPTMLVYDKKGVIRKTQVGFSPELEALLDAFVDTLLNE